LFLLLPNVGTQYIELEFTCRVDLRYAIELLAEFVNITLLSVGYNADIVSSQPVTATASAVRPHN